MSPTKMREEMLFEQTQQNDDMKLSNCLDNLFKEISSDLQIQKKVEIERTYINDEESIRTEQYKQQALAFLRDQKAVEDSEKFIKLQLLAK